MSRKLAKNQKSYYIRHQVCVFLSSLTVMFNITNKSEINIIIFYTMSERGGNVFLMTANKYMISRNGKPDSAEEPSKTIITKKLKT